MSKEINVHEIAKQLSKETETTDKQEISTLIKEARSNKRVVDVTSDVLIPTLLKMREQDRRYTVELIQRCLNDS